MNTLKDLFLDELADMYDAEHRIMKGLPTFIKAATSRELQNTLERHLQETQGRAKRIESVFSTFKESPRAKKCPAMVGIIEEGKEILAENQESPTVNAAIISAVQKIEHYQIATYGCLHAWAGVLDNSLASVLLNEILTEEKMVDKALSELSVARNQEAFEAAEADVSGQTLA